MSKQQPTYTDEFKKQIVNLYKNGKSAQNLSNEYNISKASIYAWKAQMEGSGSFKAKDNRSDSENELIALRKQNKQLLMEVDILKQAALIMARK